MKRSILPVILLLAIMLVPVATTSAGVPPAMSYQGRLLDSGGDPVADGEHPIRFGLSTEPDNEPFWYSGDMSVTTADGLFTAFLGFDPSEVSLFREHALLFLSITVAGDGGGEEILPRTLVTTSPFAFHAQHADTADYAVNSGAMPSGWVDDGTVVRLETSTDSVGIGTTSPTAKLDVEGDIHSSGAVEATALVLGANGVSGNLQMESPAATEAILDLTDGGNGPMMTAYNNSGNYVVALGANGGDGYLALSRDGLGTTGIELAGNYFFSQEPHVSFLGSSRSAIFDMSQNGDGSVQLPASSISSSEIRNEAGSGGSNSGGSVGLNTSVGVITSRLMKFPTSGYVLAVATADLGVGHTEYQSNGIEFGVSSTSSAFEPNQSFTWATPYSGPSGNYYDVITVHGYLPVEAGCSRIYFLGQVISGPTATVYQGQLTVLFVPTSYSVTICLSGSPTEEEPGDIIPAETTVEPTVEELVKRETASIRAEYGARLDAIQRQMLELLGGQSTENAGK